MAIRGNNLTFVAEVEAEEESARRVNPEVLEEDVERMDAFVQDVADAEEGGGRLSRRRTRRCGSSNASRRASSSVARAKRINKK